MDYWKIYNEGKEECIMCNNDVNKGVNPYGTLTEEWKIWNKGWNSSDISSDISTDNIARVDGAF